MDNPVIPMPNIPTSSCVGGLVPSFTSV